MSLITIDFRDRKLIYEQLVDNVKELIVRGDLKRDDPLPSVRSLAKELGINPNTIQKAYTELENQGVIATLVGRGSFVMLDRESMAENAIATLKAELYPLMLRAKTLGMTPEAFQKISMECWPDDNSNGGEHK